jgi:spore coat protein CotH
MVRLTVVLAFVLNAPPLLAAPDPILDPAVLHETRLTMDPADWQALRDDYRSNQYYAADVGFDGTVLQQVGVRSRGEGSRDPNKPALKIDFNRYVPNQRLRSLKSVSLKNLVQDPSMLRERLSMAVFEGMGLPAPSVSFTRVYVNGEYWGLYNLIESVDKTFLESRLGQDGGNLFSYQWMSAPPYDLAYKGDDPAAYVPAPFEPETNETTVDPAGLVEFIRAVNETPDEGYGAAMGRYLDVERFLTYVAIENAIQETDGLVGQQGMNNFYLYQFRDERRFTFIPWDKNTTFHQAEWPIAHRLDTNVLTRRLLRDPALQRVYVDAVRRAVATIVNERVLVPMLDAAWAQIRESALADPRKPYDNATLEAAVAGLRGVVAGREGNVLAQAAELGVGELR